MISVDFAARLQALAPGVFPDGLRPAQEHVLEQYAAQHTATPDVGIELPTGEGKTLIGLLIADWALDQGHAVAYLTGTRQLADQVLEQAQVLPGLTVHQFSGGNYPGGALDDYHQAQAVGVMNYWVYFNASPRVGPADLVIFDDAHLAEQPIAGMFTVRIARTATGGRTLYEQICDLVLHEAPQSHPTLQALRDGTAPHGIPPELVAFTDWRTVAGSVRDTVDASLFLATNLDARLVWRELSPALTRCGVLIGPTAIEIRPYHPPTQTIPGYRRAQQRIYLSATLGRPGDLQRRLGLPTVAGIETPEQLQTTRTGRRILLLNPNTAPALESPTWDFAERQLDEAAAAGEGRAAWLCASNAEADEVECRLVTAGRPVERLRSGEDAAYDRWRTTQGGQLVTAGRFDGFDLPDEVCRLVLLPSVPAASSEFERFAVAYLSDASFMRHRVGQRVTQALGRANRTAHDSAMYLGLDPGFASALADPAVRSDLSREVSAAVRSALELHGDGWAATQQAAADFWRTWREPAPSAPPAAARRPGRRPGRSGPTDPDSASDEVEAATSLWLGDFARAAEHARLAADVLATGGEPEHSAFWRYVQAHAHFESDRAGDRAAAATALQDAVRSAPRTAWFVRLMATATDLAGEGREAVRDDAIFLTWDEWLREAGGRSARQLTRLRPLLTGTHNQQAEGLEGLARLCGVHGDRPAGQAATDARWTWAGTRRGQRRVWEVKTGRADAVPRGDVDQLLGQIQEEEHLHPRARVTGCLLTTLEAVEPEAARAASDTVALVHQGFILALLDRLGQLFSRYAAHWGAGTAAERGQARAAVESDLPTGDWVAEVVAPSAGRLLRAADLRTRWAAAR